jgi:peptidoglycan glycosyltransferase
MRKFGFYRVPPIDLPADEKVASGLLRPGTNRLAPRTMRIDPARTAIGQYTHADTPLQMAMVAAAIANGGTVMEPTLLERVHDGTSKRLVRRFEPRALSRAVSAQTAATVASMMSNVVRAGTGTAAQIPGVTVAGKTGTAQTGRGDLNNGWFIGFAPVEAPKVAVAVVVEDTPLSGGEVAAPIAKAMMEAVLRR